MTLIGNTAGKLHVQRQVEDYAFRGSEFEDMGFLSFTVETYERRIVTQNANVDDTHQVEENHHVSTNETCRYLTDHPKKTTHTRARRSENHNFLLNIVGTWLPRRDGEENTRPYYFASMLALLKPWREIEDLKADGETWQSTFDIFMETASRRDRDVVAGCQYFDVNIFTIVGIQGWLGMSKRIQVLMMNQTYTLKMKKREIMKKKSLMNQ